MVNKKIATGLAAIALAGTAPTQNSEAATIGYEMDLVSTAPDGANTILNYTLSNVSENLGSGNNLGAVYLSAENVIPGSANNGLGWDTIYFTPLDEIDVDGDSIYDTGIGFESPFEFTNLPPGSTGGLSFKVYGTPVIAERPVQYVPQAEAPIVETYQAPTTIPEPSSLLLGAGGLALLAGRRPKKDYQ